jgi:zinc protease
MSGLARRLAWLATCAALSACELGAGREYHVAKTVSERAPSRTSAVAPAAGLPDSLFSGAPPAEVEWPWTRAPEVSEPSLSNGARLLVVPRPGSPTAEIAIALRLDTANAAAARVFAHTLLSAAARSDAGFRELSSSASFGFAPTEEGIVLLIHTLAALLPYTLAHVLPRIVTPHLLAADYVFAKAALRQAPQYDGARKDTTNALYRAVLAGTPYADRLREPVAAEVDAVKAEDIMPLRAHLNASDVLVVIHGGESAPPSLVTARGALERLPRGRPPPPPSGLARPPTCPVTRRIVQADALQTTLALGYNTVEATHADVPALEMAAALLGPGLASRLNRNVRTKLGATYGVHAEATSFARAGIFYVSASVESSRVAEAEAAIDEEIERLGAEEPTPSELESARTRSVFASGHDVALGLAVGVTRGRRASLVAAPAVALARVTGADVRRVAALYLPRTLRCAVVATPSSGAR